MYSNVIRKHSMFIYYSKICCCKQLNLINTDFDRYLMYFGMDNTFHIFTCSILLILLLHSLSVRYALRCEIIEGENMI